MTSRGTVFVQELEIDDAAALDEIIQNGPGKKKPRRFLTCRHCGRRTRDINRHPRCAFGWRVLPKRDTACPACIERESGEQSGSCSEYPEQLQACRRATYRRLIIQVRTGQPA